MTNKQGPILLFIQALRHKDVFVFFAQNTPNNAPITHCCYTIQALHIYFMNYL